VVLVGLTVEIYYDARSYKRHTCVTWQVTNDKLPEDDTIVSKHVGVV